MNKEILDENLIKKNENNLTFLVSWIPLFILWIGIIFQIIYGFLGDLKVLGALVLLIVATGLNYYNYKLGVKVTLGIILLGVVNLVCFIPNRYFIGFGVGSFIVEIELYLLLLAILHYFLNRKEISKFINEKFNREISKEEVEAEYRSRVNGFKRNFSDKSIEELKQLANNKNLLPQAIAAAKEMLEEKM